MTKDEALTLALEALEGFNPEFVCQATHHKRKDQHSNFEPCPNVAKYDEAIVSIKKALAQPEPWEKFCDSNCVWTDHHPDCRLAEQEPVAWVHIQGNYRVPRFWELNDDEIKRGWEQHPLYTTPPQRKPLTDEEITDAVRDAGLDWHYAWTLSDDESSRLTKFARAIEAAHGIKGEA